jgi:hypothetical protein
MSDKREELIHVAEGIMKQAEELTRLLGVQQPPAPPAPTGSGMSPVIISDGTLHFTSIADAISGPNGSGPYSYLIEKHSPLIVVRHCGGQDRPSNGDYWQVTIPLTSGGGPILVKQSDQTHIQISGVPTSFTPSNPAQPGENVIIMNVIPDWNNATFDPDTLHSNPKRTGKHLSLHFANND